MFQKKLFLILAFFLIVSSSVNADLSRQYNSIQELGFNPNQPISTAGLNSFINEFDGNLIIKETDLSLSGRNNLNLDLIRIYNSNVYYKNLALSGDSYNRDALKKPKYLGYGWNFNMGKIIPKEFYWHRNQLEDIIEMPDGSTQRIVDVTSRLPPLGNYKTEKYITDKFWKVTIYNDHDFENGAPITEVQESQSFILTDLSGTKYYFNHWVSIGDGPIQNGLAGQYNSNKDPASQQPIVWSDIGANAQYVNHEYRQDPYYGVYLTKIEDIHGNYIKVEYSQMTQRDVNDPNSLNYGFNDAFHPVTYGSPLISKITDTLGREINFYYTGTGLNSKLDYITYTNVNNGINKINFVYKGESNLYGCPVPTNSCPVGIPSDICDTNKLLVAKVTLNQNNQQLENPTCYDYNENYQIKRLIYPTGGSTEYFYNNINHITPVENIEYRPIVRTLTKKRWIDSTGTESTYSYDISPTEWLKTTTIYSQSDEYNERLISRITYFQSYQIYPDQQIDEVARFNWKSGLKVKEEYYKDPTGNSNIGNAAVKLQKTTEYFYDSRRLGKIIRFGSAPGAAEPDYDTYTPLLQGILTTTYDEDGTNPKKYFVEYLTSQKSGDNTINNPDHDYKDNYDKFGQPRKIIDYGEVNDVNKVYSSCPWNYQGICSRYNNANDYLLFMRGTLFINDYGNDKKTTITHYLYEELDENNQVLHGNDIYEGSNDIFNFWDGDYHINYQIVDKPITKKILDKNNNIALYEKYYYDELPPAIYDPFGLNGYDDFKNHRRFRDILAFQSGDFSNVIKLGWFFRGNLNRIQILDNKGNSNPNDDSWINKTFIYYDDAGNIIETIDGEGNQKLKVYGTEVLVDRNSWSGNFDNYQHWLRVQFNPINGYRYGDCSNDENDDLDSCTYDINERGCQSNQLTRSEGCIVACFNDGVQHTCTALPPQNELFDIRYSDYNCMYKLGRLYECNNPPRNPRNRERNNSNNQSKNNPVSQPQEPEHFEEPGWEFPPDNYPDSETYEHAYLTREFAKGEDNTITVTYTIYYKDTGDIKEQGTYVLNGPNSGFNYRLFTKYKYDDLGRLNKIYKNQVNDDDPDTEIQYSISEYPSKISLFQKRASKNELDDQTYFNRYYPNVYFYDGLGRLIQSQQKYYDNNVIIKVKEYNKQGKEYRIYEPLTINGGTYNQYINPYQAPIYNILQQTPRIKYDKYDVQERIKKFIPLPGDTVQNPQINSKEYTYGSNWDEVKDENNILTRNEKITCTTESCAAKIRLINDKNNLNLETYKHYDVLGNTVKIINAENQNTIKTYNSMGQLLRINSPDFGNINYQYYNNGNLNNRVDNSNYQTYYHYDNLGRIKLVRYAQGAPNSHYYYDTERYSYGKLTKFIDESGITSFTYDNKARIIRKENLIEGNYYNTLYNYEDSNKITLIEYPNGDKADYIYDNLGRIVELSISNIVQNPSFEAFNEDGMPNNWQAIYVSQSGVDLTDSYTGAASVFIDSQPGQPDAFEQIINIENGATYTVSGYVKAQCNDSNCYSSIFTQCLNSNGMPISCGLDTPQSIRDSIKIRSTRWTYINYKINADSQNAAQVRIWCANSIDPWGQSPAPQAQSRIYCDNVRIQKANIEYEYNSDNTLFKKNYGNDIISNFKYDGRKLLCGFRTYDKNDNRILQRTYTYDKVGNIKVELERQSQPVRDYSILCDPSAAPAQNDLYIYDYDNIYRIQHTNLQYPQGQNDHEDITYDYDNLGNIMSVVTDFDNTNPVTVNYQYTDPASRNRLTNDGIFSYIYNNKGNLLSKTGQGLTTNYYYDYENRLRKISYQNNQCTLISYNANDLRIKKIEQQSTTTYLYNDNNVIQEITTPTSNLNCQVDNTCNNNKVEFGEVCDGNDLNGLRCQYFQYEPGKYYQTGEVSCNSDCRGFNLNGCGYCGDGELNVGEACDPSANPVSCHSIWQGFDNTPTNTASCSNYCTVNTDSCRCTDPRTGVVNYGLEDCRIALHSPPMGYSCPVPGEPGRFQIEYAPKCANGLDDELDNKIDRNDINCYTFSCEYDPCLEETNTDPELPEGQYNRCGFR